MGRYILALDAGTTSNRAILFDREGRACWSAQREFTQHFPKPGWVEQDPKEIWATMMGVITEALAQAGLEARDLEAIGITNQRETTILWDKETGEPVYPAIVWQCRRTADQIENLKQAGHGPAIRAKTGLILDPYYSASKIRWILDHIDQGQARAEAGELLFGTVDSWLLYKLSRGRLHVSDYSNAARTMLFNIHTLCWDPALLALFHIPRVLLPEVRPSSEIYGTASVLGAEVPLASACGDQQAALFGQTCFAPGEAKNTYGTGAFLLMNTGEKAVPSQNGLVTTIAWGLEEGKVSYALEGSIFVAGSSIQWLRDELRILDSAKDSAYYATQVPDTGGVYVVPAFTGLGAPYWDPYARGLIVGLTRGSNRYHIVRATLESQAYLSYDVLCAMSEDLGHPLRKLQVDGGASANDFLMQFQADMAQVEVIRPKVLETTALGAAYLAGLATGYWKDLSDIRSHWQEERRFQPALACVERDRLYRRWQKAVARARNWAREEDC